MKRIFAPLFLAFCLFSLPSFAQVTGIWKTIDDETGKAKSHVEIYEKDGKIYGKVIKILDEKKVNEVCTKCTDYRKDKPVMGMEIISNMAKGKDSYEGGKILDPEKGKIYRCELWRDGETLKVRGYVAFLYRTQTWHKVK